MGPIDFSKAIKVIVAILIAFFMLILAVVSSAQTPLVTSPTIPSPTLELTTLYPGDRVELDYRPMVYTGAGIAIGSATWDISRNLGFNRIHPFEISAGTDRIQVFDGSRYLGALDYAPPDLFWAYGSGNVIEAATGYLVARPTPIPDPTLPPAPVTIRGGTYTVEVSVHDKTTGLPVVIVHVEVPTEE